SRAMLIAARSSNDFACCSRATVSECSKYASAFAASCSVNAISPAKRSISASNHLSLVVSTVVVASPMLRQASSNWPSYERALAKYDKKRGTQYVAPVDRHEISAEVIVWTVSDGRPVRAEIQPRVIIPLPLHCTAPAASATETSSSTRVLAFA